MKKKSINKNNLIILFLSITFIVLTIVGLSFKNQLKTFRQGKSAYRYTDGKEDEFFPFDEEEAADIDNSEPIGEDETWAIYMFLNGSNLELGGHSQLSEFVEYTTNQAAEERKRAESEEKKNRINEFISTEEANNIPMPLSFYEADYVKAKSEDVPEENHATNNSTWGSDILSEFTEAELPDNFTYVVQPGGATAWKNEQVNPNRTRRFVKKGGELKEVYDAPVSNMGESETLADFLTFCKENYPADHTMVILTDHGGAMTGFGWEYIYGEDHLSLKELTEAFDMAYGTDEENPPIDLLYYNACIMSNTDVINSMRGVASYMVAGEELGWAVHDYYGIWLNKVKENPHLNPRQLGKCLIDSYTIDLTKNCAFVGSPNTSGLCLLDMSKAPLVYDAYAQFARNVLENIADNPDLLMSFSKAVSSSISFAIDYYKVYNLTDLGLWVEALKDKYPEESKTMIELIDDAVIYKRADSYLLDAHGISVYFPNYIESTTSLSYVLDYIDNISYSEDISALYYYKAAGCLNDKYKAYCKKEGIKEPGIVNYEALEKLRNYELTDADGAGNIKGNIPKSTIPVVMDLRYELCKVNESDNTVICYGEDRFVNPDVSNGIETDFEGKWVAIGGKKFAVNVINVTYNCIIYESPVMYQDTAYKLIIKCEIDPENNENIYTISGLRAPSDNAATVERNVLELKPGSYITPIYEKTSITGGEITTVTGSQVLYSNNTRICDEALEKGKYRARVVFEDMRGDDVYSDPIFFNVD